MLDREYLKTEMRQDMNALTYEMNDQILTDTEIDFLIDVHFKIMDVNHPLKINDLVTCENLIR